MDFMSNPSSSSIHRRSSTTAPPPNHHPTAGATPASEDSEDDGSLKMMPLFSTSEANASTTTTTAPPPPPSSSAAGGGLVEKEHMFDKVVTPSDVGKLNRLVIPKQHAERYFPLDSSTNEKGLFLNFEDRNGKPWRFRYSYWNSSQSYVMTKGWSRFVKEKKLDAGDIVSFQRGLGELGRDRLFIDWRRRPDAPDNYYQHQLQYPSFPLHHHRSLIPWTISGNNNPMVNYYQQQQPHHHNHYGSTSTSSYGYNSNAAIVEGNPCPPGSVMYLRHGAGNGYGFDNYGAHHQQYQGIMQFQRGNNGNNSNEQQQQQRVFDSVPVVQGKAAAKRLRLFGVNMDCPVPADDDEPISTAAPVLHSYRGFMDHSSSSSLSVPPSLRLRPYSVEDDDDDDDDDGDDDDEEEDDDKGKGASMSLDLEI